MTQMQRHYRNGFNQESEEYEDDEYDYYEEDGVVDDADDNEEKVEELKPSNEELEFLKLREKLKEKFRQKLKKQSVHNFGHSSQSQDRNRTSTNNNFGSFFGPSRPVIASRVLDESRSIRDTQHITSKVPSTSSGHGVSAFSSSDGKSFEHQQIPKVNEVKKKIQTLKDTRDYSFLFSDDADLPDKEPQSASRHVSTPNPVALSVQAPLQSKVISSKPLKYVYNGREVKNSESASRHVQSKAPKKVTQVNRHNLSSAEPKKISVRYAAGVGPGKPVEPKPLPKPMQSKVPLQSKVDGQVMVTKKPNAKVVNGVSSQMHVSTLRPYISTQNHYVEPKAASHFATTVRVKPKPAPKQAVPLKSQPPKTVSSRDIHDELLTRKPVKRKHDDANPIQIIRQMFRYNPSKYTGMDDDDSDMEADFSQIEQEERRSSLIAMKEDAEQLHLIEEEERRERMRKKRKLLNRR